MGNILKYEENYAKEKYIDEDTLLWGEVEQEDDPIILDQDDIDEKTEDFEKRVENYLKVRQKR